MVKAIFLLSFLATAVIAVEVHRCGDAYPHPTAVVIPGCNAMPCPVPNNSDFSFAVEFESSIATNSLAVNVTASLGPFNLPYDTPEHLRDGCANIDANCPLTAGQRVTMRGTAPVEAPIIGVTVRMRFEITGDSAQKVVCFAADVRLVA
ncbi:uncharacterized protein LOC129762490 [Toxorhynchites rutilus septentrionalis]|uniref:uncharacterized protein LOC129762490 n=1 Tax=Toxorhynchites rutilus septentrionalis TaxID=329112 RepID=UPI00247AB19F|nr:uncharacterized protein LOC129762490 [Toxorhynchites rutilus septentrionalis]